VKRHIVLVGLPGSGKSEVGRIVAETLQAAFVDLDQVVARKEGKPIAMIFAEHGEAAFRQLERREMAAAMEQEASVIAPGGGWGAQPGNLEGARARCWLVYLRTRPESAAARTPPDGSRPLLAGGVPMARVGVVLRQREPLYRQADAQVDTDGQTVRAVAAQVVRLAQTGAGW
jgi:shikimate kinase